MPVQVQKSGCIGKREFILVFAVIFSVLSCSQSSKNITFWIEMFDVEKKASSQNNVINLEYFSVRINVFWAREKKKSLLFSACFLNVCRKQKWTDTILFCELGMSHLGFSMSGLRLSLLPVKFQPCFPSIYYLLK